MLKRRTEMLKKDREHAGWWYKAFLGDKYDAKAIDEQLKAIGEELNAHKETRKAKEQIDQCAKHKDPKMMAMKLAAAGVAGVAAGVGGALLLEYAKIMFSKFSNAKLLCNHDKEEFATANPPAAPTTPTPPIPPIPAIRAKKVFIGVQKKRNSTEVSNARGYQRDAFFDFMDNTGNNVKEKTYGINTDVKFKLQKFGSRFSGLKQNYDRFCILENESDEHHILSDDEQLLRGFVGWANRVYEGI